MGSMMNDDDGAFLKKVGTTHERDERKQKFFFLLVFFFEKNENFRRESVFLGTQTRETLRLSLSLSLFSFGKCGEETKRPF
tara:strand:+ start:1968 stop:2210 length:243 start_codon:yes stop_codon:yes gene_type:complete